MGISLFTEIKKNLQKAPMLIFILSFLRDLLIASIVVIGVRSMYAFVEWSSKFISPTNTPEELVPYLPINMTNWMVTVMDTVAIIAITVIGIYNLVELVGVVMIRYKQQHCPKSDCPYKKEITNEPK